MTMLENMMGEHLHNAYGYLEAIHTELVSIHEALTPDPDDVTDKVQRKITQQNSGTGQVVVDIGQVPNGATWLITRLAVQGTPAKGVRLWADQIGGTLLDKVITDVDGDFADAVAENPVISEGRRVLVEFLGQAAAQQCNAWLQVEQYQDRATRRTI